MRIYVKRGIDEATKKNVDRIRKLVKGDRFYGKSDLIQSWAIITAENPMAQELSPEENAERDQKLRSALRREHLEYIVIDGKFGKNYEHPLFVINPSLKDMKFWAATYRQQTFIYTDVVRNDPIDGEFDDDVLMIYQYYEVKNPKAQNLEYVLREEKEQDAEDFEKDFSAVKSGQHRFKWVIPFLEDLFIQGCDIIYEKYGWKRLPTMVQGTIDLLENQNIKTGSSLYAQRCQLYSTIDNEISGLQSRINILERLRERSKVDSLNSRYLPKDKGRFGRR